MVISATFVYGPYMLRVIPEQKIVQFEMVQLLSYLPEQPYPLIARKDPLLYNFVN